MEFIVLDSADLDDKENNMCVAFDWGGPIFVTEGSDNDDTAAILEQVVAYCQAEDYDYFEYLDDIEDQDEYEEENPDAIYLDCTTYDGVPCYVDGVHLTCTEISDDEIEEIWGEE